MKGGKDEGKEPSRGWKREKKISEGCKIEKKKKMHWRIEIYIGGKIYLEYAQSNTDHGECHSRL